MPNQVNQGLRLEGFQPKDKAGVANSWLSTRWAFLGLGICFAFAVLREIRHWGYVYRALDAGIYLFAGGLGIAVAHTLVKQSMENSKQRLRALVDTYLGEWKIQKQAWLAKEEQQMTAAVKAPVAAPLLPIPYIVSRLRDADADGFGYFAAKLVNRDPRLLLDLALDEALLPGDDKKIWDTTQEMKETQKTAETTTTTASAEKIARNVADAVIAKLRGDVETAVNEALKKAQEQSDKQKPGGSHG